MDHEVVPCSSNICDWSVGGGGDGESSVLRVVERGVDARVVEIED